MQSRKSCFNRAAYAKNLTRFAPVLALYTLLLMLLTLMGWKQAGDSYPEFNFFYQVGGLFGWLAILNVGFACLMAQLLFGDLYNTRMCNALHALPLRRETWFVTNCLSGLTYSLIPTAINALILLPFLMRTVFVGAWKIAVWYFVAANAEFICLFGIAVFCTMMVGSRFTMVAAYGLVNFGSGILYWLVDTIYTPMLYGIITPNTLATKLMPAYYMMNIGVDIKDRRDYFDEVGRLLPNARGIYEITNLDCLGMLALVGIVFAVIALLLYRRRNLECAGDAVCSRKLVPLFQILCSLFVAVAAEFAATEFLGLGGTDSMKFLFLFCGLVVGWFTAKMLVERSARVFGLRNWIGLAVLAAVFAATMGINKLDVFGIEERMPQAADVASVKLGSYEMKDPADIEKVLKFHTLALNDRVKDSGAYVLEENGEYVLTYDSTFRYWQEGDPLPTQRIAVQKNLTYTLKDGRVVRRRYNVWADSPAGEASKALLSRWDAVSNDTIRMGDKDVRELDLVLAGYEQMGCDYSGRCPENLRSRAAAESLLRAIQADCAAGNMAQDSGYHNGVFAVPQEFGDIYENDAISVYLQSKNNSWYVQVFPECENTIRWLRENGLLREDISILTQRSGIRYY